MSRSIFTEPPAKILPCPHCGVAPEMAVTSGNYSLACYNPECKRPMKFLITGYFPDTVTNSWNERVAELATK